MFNLQKFCHAIVLNYFHIDLIKKEKIGAKIKKS